MGGGATCAPDADAAPREESWLEDVVIALGLAVVAVVASYFIAWTFDRTQIYDTINTILDGDTITRRYLFADDIRNRIFFKHPNLGHYVNPPIRILAAILGGDAATTRWALALWVVPIAAGFKTAATFLTLRLMRLRLVESLSVTILSAVTFSHLLFESTPDSFGLTGAWLAVMLLAGAWAVRTRDGTPQRRRVASWLMVLAGTVGAGFTVTNVAPFAIVAAIVERVRGRSFGATLGRVAAGSALVVALNVAVCAAFVATSFSMKSQREMPMGIGAFFHAQPLARTAHMIITVSDGFAPPAPHWVPHPEGRRRPYFSIEESPRSLVHRVVIPGLVWAALIAGAVGCARGTTVMRTIAFAAGACFVFHVALLSVWGGDELIIYALHWEAGLVLLLGGLFPLAGRFRKWVIPVLGAATIALAVNNVSILRGMLAAWERDGPEYRISPARDLVRP